MFDTIKELVIYVTEKLDGNFPEEEFLTPIVKKHFPNADWKTSDYDWCKSRINTEEFEANEIGELSELDYKLMDMIDRLSKKSSQEIGNKYLHIERRKAFNVIVKSERDLALIPSMENIFSNLDDLMNYLMPEIAETCYEHENFSKYAKEYFEKSDEVWYLQEKESEYLPDTKCYFKVNLKEFSYDEGLVNDFIINLIPSLEIRFHDLNDFLSSDKYL